MKRIIPLLLLCILCSCANSPKEEIIKSLPAKENPDSSLMSKSPIGAYNIDDYLFLDNVLYIDTRSSEQFLINGHIAGFINIPFYETIASFEKKDNVLFKMEKIRNNNGELIANVGDVGSFIPNYEESEEYLNHVFPKDKQLVIIATAGVESSYLINLLLQYGYDGNNLYNAGAMENSLAKNIAYFDLENPRYKIDGIDAYKMKIEYNWGELTPYDDSFETPIE